MAKVEENLGVVFHVVPGQILSFDGSNTISTKFIEDSEFFVTLILKKL